MEFFLDRQSLMVNELPFHIRIAIYKSAQAQTVKITFSDLKDLYLRFCSVAVHISFLMCILEPC